MPSRQPRLPDLAATYAQAIIAAARREYPHALHHASEGPGDHHEPHELHPAFYGCYDWHSAVHMQWALVRLARLAPEKVDVDAVRALLDERLTADNLTSEAEYLKAHPAWERPYGWGWLLTLADEIADWARAGDRDASRWAKRLRPLVETVVELMLAWLDTQQLPVRAGTHGSSAFALERALPWAVRQASAGDVTLLEKIEDTARAWFGEDRDAPLHWEPQGTDFLSPSLTEATLMLEVLSADEFSTWLARFLPTLAFSARCLGEPATVPDPTDGQMAHLDGLNLTRAWHLRRIAAVLPHYDLRRKVCLQAAADCEAASLPAVVGGDWMAEHWLATFAICALTAPGTADAPSMTP